MRVEFLTLPNGKQPAQEFLDDLDERSEARVTQVIGILERQGYLLFPQARKLEGYRGLWELRVVVKRKALRIFYAYQEREVVTLISGFVKKSQKTPRRELKRAIQYLKLAGIHL